MLKIISFIIFILTCNQAFSQNCPDTIVYRTADLGNGIEQLGIPLKFKIYPDSIVVRNDAPDEKPSLMDVSFRILEKVCKWNKDFSEGMSLYRVVLNDTAAPRKAIINIRLSDKQGKIQLLYENSEPRIFNIR